MKLNISLFLSLMCIGPSFYARGRPNRAKSFTTTTIQSSMSNSWVGLERRVGKPDDSKDDEDASSLELDEIESTVINGTDREERFFNKFRHHVFKKKKRPSFIFSTVTQTSTVTALMTSSTVGLCAQLVNITGPCRLRRGMWRDDPIVLSFDDDMDSIDDAFSPSKALSIEMSAMPDATPIFGGGPSETIKNANRDRRISVRSGSVIHSSKEDEGESRDDDDGDTKVHCGFFGWKKKFKKKIKFITVITTTLVTSTYYVAVSTNTFFIQLCTPSPFPFNICNGRKKRQMEIEQSKKPK